METQLLTALKNNKLLGGFDVSKFNLDNVKGKLISLFEGQILFKEGTDAREVYLLVSGELNEVRRNPEGRPSSFIYLDNEFFGLNEMLENSKRGSTAVALKDSYIIALTQKELNIIGKQDKEFASKYGLNIPEEEFFLKKENSESDNETEITELSQIPEPPAPEIEDDFPLEAPLIDQLDIPNDPEFENIANNLTLHEDDPIRDDEDDLSFLNVNEDDFTETENETEKNETAEDSGSMFISPEGEKRLTEELKKLEEKPESENEPAIENETENELPNLDEISENIETEEFTEYDLESEPGIEFEAEEESIEPETHELEEAGIVDEPEEETEELQSEQDENLENKNETELPEGWEEVIEESGFKDENDITEEDLLRALGETFVEEPDDLSPAEEIKSDEQQEDTSEEPMAEEIHFEDEFTSEKIDETDFIAEPDPLADLLKTEETPSDINDIAEVETQDEILADETNEDIVFEETDQIQALDESASLESDLASRFSNIDEAETIGKDDILNEAKNEFSESSGDSNNQLRKTIFDEPVKNESAALTSEQLHKIIKAAEFVNSNIKIDDVLKSIVDVATDITNADRGTLYLVDNEKKELWSKISIGNESREIRLKIGEGIAGWVAEKNEIININNVHEDKRFNSNFDRTSGYQTKSMLCFPIRNREDKIIGVLQLLNSANGEFSAMDEEFLQMISVHAALALENADLVEKLLQTERVSSLGKMANFLIQDIKKPLLVTKRYTEHLNQKDLPSDIKQLVKMMLDQLNQVTDIVQTTSSYSEGRAILRTLNVSLNETLKDYCDRVESFVRTRNCRIITEFDRDVNVKIDVKEFFQCFNHIIKNACDAMPEGGNIAVSTKRVNDKINISLKDTGLGIPDTLKAKVFEPFMSHGKKDGTGLGLSVTKKLIEEMSGTIGFESQVGEGTTFIVSFPVNNLV